MFFLDHFVLKLNAPASFPKSAAIRPLTRRRILEDLNSHKYSCDNHTKT